MSIVRNIILFVIYLIVSSIFLLPTVSWIIVSGILAHYELWNWWRASIGLAMLSGIYAYLIFKNHFYKIVGIIRYLFLL